MGKPKFGYYLDVADVSILGPNTTVETIEYDQFFALRNQGISSGGKMPLPEGVRQWNDAIVEGETVLAAQSDEHLYIIAEPSDLGLTLFHYVFRDGKSSRYTLADNLPTRTLLTERSIKIMSELNLSNIAARPMNFGGSQAPSLEPVSGGMGTGIGGSDSSTGLSLEKVRKTALALGYVTGYIMNSAPAITVSLSSKRVKESANADDRTYSIVAKESKPGRCLRVLMAVPACCCRKGGRIADPTEIQQCTIDFDTAGEDLVKLCLIDKAAVGFIGAFGGYMAEYAPFVSDAKTQWSREAILSEMPGVSYVYLKPVNSKKGNMRLVMRSTSDRNSLYTRKNIVCLRAMQHVDTTCTTEEDEYRLNRIAFETWRYRKRGEDAKSSLEKAYDHCGTQVWKAHYNINGEDVEGVGSCFFMRGATGVNGDGKTVDRKELTYFPWYQTGSQRPKTATPVTSMVDRVFQPAEKKRKERMVPVPILYREKPDAKVFQQYQSFIRFIISEGYITQDGLTGLSGRSSRASKSVRNRTANISQSLQSYLDDEEVKKAIAEVQSHGIEMDIIRTSR